MSLKGKQIGMAFTGSFCTYQKAFEQLQKLTNTGAVIQTIFSDSAAFLAALSLASRAAFIILVAP